MEMHNSHGITHPCDYGGDYDSSHGYCGENNIDHGFNEYAHCDDCYMMRMTTMFFRAW